MLARLSVSVLLGVLAMVTAVFFVKFVSMGIPGGSISAWNPDRVWHKVTLDEPIEWSGRNRPKVRSDVSGVDEHGRRWECSISKESRSSPIMLWIDGGCTVFRGEQTGYYLTTKGAGILTELYRFQDGENEVYVRRVYAVGQTNLGGECDQYCHIFVTVREGLFEHGVIQGDCKARDQNFSGFMQFIQDKLEFVSGTFTPDI